MPIPDTTCEPASMRYTLSYGIWLYWTPLTMLHDRQNVKRLTSVVKKVRQRLFPYFPFKTAFYIGGGIASGTIAISRCTPSFLQPALRRDSCVGCRRD